MREGSIYCVFAVVADRSRCLYLFLSLAVVALVALGGKKGSTSSAELFRRRVFLQPQPSVLPCSCYIAYAPPSRYSRPCTTASLGFLAVIPPLKMLMLVYMYRLLGLSHRFVENNLASVDTGKYACSPLCPAYVRFEHPSCPPIGPFRLYISRVRLVSLLGGCIGGGA